jgi:hypothetical protein
MSNSIFLLRFHYELHGQNCENGYWFHGTSTCSLTFPTVLDELTQLMAQWDATVRPKIAEFMTDDAHFQRLDGITKDPQFGPVHSIIYETGGGLQANDALPGFNAGVLSLYTGNGGRQNRGRSYYSSVPEDRAVDGVLDSTAFLALKAIGDELLLRFGPSTIFPCWRYMLFHQKAFASGVPLQNALSFIVETRARREIRSQRHRMLGHGT